MDLLDLSDFFNTKSEADDFSQRMSFISKQIFETDFNPNVALLEHFGIEKRDAFMTILRNNKVNSESRKSIKEFIDLLLVKIATLPVFSLTLAFEPKQPTLKMLSQWFVLNTKKQVIFDIKVDNTLIGGAALMSSGKYLDFSLKPKFEDIYKEMFEVKKEPKKEETKEIGASKDQGIKVSANQTESLASGSIPSASQGSKTENTLIQPVLEKKNVAPNPEVTKKEMIESATSQNPTVAKNAPKQV